MIAYMGGFGSAKTFVGILKATHLSMFPNNRGIVGRLNSTDLEDTTQRDMLDFLREAELLKEAPNVRTKRATVYCVDPLTGKNLGYTSEISFQHMDDPTHLRGRKIGWFWIDEASEVHKDAGKNLMARMRLPAFAGRYQALYTGNPEGHNYIYDDFFNEELIKKLVCGHPQCTLSPEECNKNLRLKRRGIHAPTYENYFLPPDYVQNMLASYSPTERQRYLDGSFDVFEGAVFPEFSRELHLIGNEI
jgi:PBSX family phage terminase large subunit